jgi:two-component SAPR family response regulator
MYAEGLRLKGLNLYRLGESTRAVEALEHSLTMYYAIKETGTIPIVLMETGMVHLALGDVQSAIHAYQEALEYQKAERNFHAQAEILNNFAVLYHQLGEYELASETFELGLAAARRSRNLRAEILILTGLGDLYSEIEEFDAALQAYVQVEQRINSQTGSFLSNYLVVAKGFLWLLKNDLEGAAELLQMNRRTVRNSPSNYERGLWWLFEGRYYLLKGEAKKAVRLLQECKAFFSEDGRLLEKQWSIIWLSAACEQAGQHDAARAELSGLLAATSSLDHALVVAFRQAVKWLSSLQSDTRSRPEMSMLFDRVRRLDAKLPAVRRLLRRHAQSIQMPAAGLVIHAFGHPEVVVDGRVVSMSDWMTQSVRDLFFYFLYRQDRVTKEKLAAELWPETDDPQALKVRFKNEIYRLRRVVGRTTIVFNEEYYCFNRSLDYDYDVEVFDLLLDRARRSRTDTERVQHLQNAVDLVKGPYLEGVDTAWADVERVRLAQAHVTALEEAAHLYLGTSQLSKCLSVCHDRCNETIYQLEMRAYGTLGDRAAVIRRYQACKNALQEALGLPPSPETEQMFLELTQS